MVEGNIHVKESNAGEAEEEGASFCVRVYAVLVF